ncbi:hypothetical protein [Cytobacillus dafuensis]|uniref:Uncharacterized protein n=1 Tax=Cytobacillus dafuensis TaxID=1742359 RepID=A0A5B8Z5R1_CYTDA|nr:hypothetical protein [Cytobacillus dafuensis]QED48460.1 hypothetical protein FSZ17_15095 [Cytobacillus dafuensis]
MNRHAFYCIISFFCGLLFIEWFPIPIINITELVFSYILNPLNFFAASLVIIVGVLITAEMIREEMILKAIDSIKNRECNFNVLICIIFVINFITLINIGFWQTVVFFCFSIIYGIISIDF